MPDVALRLPVTEALAALLATVTGRTGDVGRAPDPPALPYWILYPIPGGGPVGPPAIPDADVALPYQITSVGGRADQAQWLADQARSALLHTEDDGRYTHPLDPDGLTVMAVTADGSGGLDPDQQLPSVADRYLIWVTTS